MKVISLINQKGGVGKSTITTNIAAALANRNKKVAVADLDTQQSFASWINARPDGFAKVFHGKIKDGKVVDYEKENALNLDYLVLDTPSGLKGDSLKKVALMSDKIVVPIKPGFFDILSTKNFLQEVVDIVLATEKEIDVGLVGNAMDLRTKATQHMLKFIETSGLDNPMNIRNGQIYVHLTAYGLTIFDEKTALFKKDTDLWTPFIEWLEK